MQWTKFVRSGLACVATLIVSSLATTPIKAQNVTPPDLGVCNGVECEVLPHALCSDAGFKITLTNYTPANNQNSGSASYTYELCSPPAGTCTGGIRFGESCLDNSFCQKKGSNEDPTATCSRECATNTFRGLSHFDVTFPELGGTNSCLSSTTDITVTCSNGNPAEGDASCFDSGSSSFVAKCDNTSLAPGQCLTMTVTIAGELNGLGLGAAIVVDKESNTCTSSCLAGPSCDRCDPLPPGGACLTRTIGFWGTHPWITNDYDPVTVCGKPLDCSGVSDGKSNPTCLAGSCTSVMEGLGSIGGESPKDSSYIAMVKQLTAAKLNLNATSSLFNEASCSDWTYQNKTIQEWITSCEALCGTDKSTISNSGCIEALNAFNNSEDVGFTITPAPFERPPLDDFGNISGADSSGFSAAQGNSGSPKLVIGKKIGGNDCR